MVHAYNIYLWWNMKYIREKPWLFSILFFVIHVYVLKCLWCLQFYHYQLHYVFPGLAFNAIVKPCNPEQKSSDANLGALDWTLLEPLWMQSWQFRLFHESNKAEVKHNGMMMCLNEVLDGALLAKTTILPLIFFYAICNWTSVSS